MSINKFTPRYQAGKNLILEDPHNIIIKIRKAR